LRADRGLPAEADVPTDPKTRARNARPVFSDGASSSAPLLLVLHGESPAVANHR